MTSYGLYDFLKGGTISQKSVWQEQSRHGQRYPLNDLKKCHLFLVFEHVKSDVPENFFYCQGIESVPLAQIPEGVY
jgi:hypothetical protein